MGKAFTSQTVDNLFILQEQTWLDKAACRKLPKKLFFSEKKDDPNIQTAKAVCNYCPVRAECLAYALTSPWMSGVFGGTDERERRLLLKRRIA